MKVSSTTVPNLVRSVDSNIYYARIRVGPHLKWKSLRTKSFNIAKGKLKDTETELKGGAGGSNGLLNADLTFHDAFRFYEVAVRSNPDLKDSTKHFRLRSEKTLVRTWPELWDKELRRVKAEDCQRWYRDFRNGGAAFTPNRAKSKRSGDSPTTVNAAIRFLREVFKVGVDAGVLSKNPADALKTLSPRKKLLQLPNRTQFAELIAEVRKTHSRWGQAPGDLVEGLAYTGARVGEARRMTWAHVDEERGMVTIPGEKTDAAPRVNPITPAFKGLLGRMRAKGSCRPVDPLFGVRSVLGSLKQACAALGLPKLDHHDLRHLFATTCIESGVDVLTIASWLGHSDGGKLVLETYGHLRPAHSTLAAKLVDFSPPTK